MAGLGIFLLYHWQAAPTLPPQQSRAITVDRSDLLQFMQFRLKAFQPQLINEKFDALSVQEHQRLIEDYVREEVLYREALNLGLDRNDYVLKQRVIQRVEFALRGLIEYATKMTEEDIQQWYDTHPENYQREPALTFTHVFFSTDLHSRTEALSLALATLEKLRGDRVPFAEATRYGDRFPYHTNYVERDRSYVESQFGRLMTDALFALKPSPGDWFGPFQSAYGFHLVQVTSSSKSGKIPLDSIRERVTEDARRNRINDLLERNIQGLVDSYAITLSEDI